jgi:hypothetical protein
LACLLRVKFMAAAYRPIGRAPVWRKDSFRCGGGPCILLPAHLNLGVFLGLVCGGLRRPKQQMKTVSLFATAAISTVCLLAGLSGVAEKFDPLQPATESVNGELLAGEPCVFRASVDAPRSELV